jgi:predicted dehydrogenase
VSNQNPSRVRVGVVGCGAIAQVAHLPALRELDDRFEVVALCDVDERTLLEVADAWGIQRRHTELGDLLAERPDVVAILSGGDHAEAVLAALAAGCHVFVEKPLTYMLAATDEILAAAQTADRLVLVGMTKRYDAGYARTCQEVRALRDLRCVDVRVLHPESALLLSHVRLRGREAFEPAPLLGKEFDEFLQRAILENEPRERLAELTGSTEPGPLLTAFFLIASVIHDVNALRGVLGEPTEVLAAEAWAGGTQLAAILAFGEDIRATYAWSFLPHLRHYVHRYSFLGSEERVHLSFPSAFIADAASVVEVETTRDGHFHRTEITPSHESPFLRELIHLHECLTEGRPPLTDAADFRRDLEVLHAIAAAL